MPIHIHNELTAVPFNCSHVHCADIAQVNCLFGTPLLEYYSIEYPIVVNSSTAAVTAAAVATTLTTTTTTTSPKANYYKNTIDILIIRLSFLLLCYRCLNISESLS